MSGMVDPFDVSASVPAPVITPPAPVAVPTPAPTVRYVAVHTEPPTTATPAIPSYAGIGWILAIVFGLWLGVEHFPTIWHGGFHLPHIKTYSGPLRATLVYDADSDNPAVTAADLKADATIATRLASLQCAWRAVDKDDLAATRLKTITDGKSYPVLVIQEDGTPGSVWVGESPANGDGIVAKVKELRGTKQ